MKLSGIARPIVALLMVLASLVGFLAVQACACTAGLARAGETGWREHLQAAETAIAEGNVSQAVRGWHNARGAALRTDAWDALIEVGNASLRIGEAAAARYGARAEARGLYLHALFRARAQHSLDGVLRATEAFANLGDADVVEQGLHVARQLAAPRGPAARERVRETAVRLGARHSMAGTIDTSL
jgi:hypothetical protein